VKNIAQNVAQYAFVKKIRNLNCGKSSQKMWATSAIFKKQPKVNSHPTG
jgi:hypothetical protein